MSPTEEEDGRSAHARPVLAKRRRRIKAEPKNGSPPPSAGSGPGVVAPPRRYTASIYPGPLRQLPDGFVRAVQDLEAELGKPVWLFVQGHEAPEPFDTVHPFLTEAFVQQKADMPRTGAAVLVESPGGDAHTAFGLACLFQRRCGQFDAVIPRWAKSAATLFSLGAESIFMGEDAQIGPLDAQFVDQDREEAWMSALDEVGMVSSLQGAVLDSAAAALRLMRKRTGKKLNVLMPPVFDLLAKLHRPLFDKVDTLRFSRMSRLLDIAQQYAVRLLQRKYNEPDSWAVARDLVTRYPAHRFWIDRDEAKRIGKRESGNPVGLPIAECTPELDSILDRLYGLLDGSITALGRLEEAGAKL